MTLRYAAQPIPDGTVDCTPAFNVLEKRVRTCPKVLVEINEHTYLPQGELTEGWLPNILGAFKKLAARDRTDWKVVRSFCSIGVGPGLEAIGAVETLDAKDLVLADLHWDVVGLARRNVLRNCPGIRPIRARALVSDTCGELITHKIRVDLLYENLPNLPAKEIEVSTGVLAASFFDEDRLGAVPGTYARYMLSLHYSFLRQARQCLLEGGRVVCCIGGRVSNHVLQGLFRDTGYTAEVLNFEMVRQFESERVLTGYASAEKEEGVTFRYFRYEEARQTLSDLRREGVSAIDEVLNDPRMKTLSLTATEAHKLQGQGIAIGHIGIVWLAIPEA